MKNPHTSSEWQEAVNAAQFFLALDSARLYGLLTSGPEVNVERCENILHRGKQLGFVPADIKDLTKQFLIAQRRSKLLTSQDIVDRGARADR